ncbi:LuxR C-terminal-related transcriptional regulator [Amycolatopsis sp. NPDC051758]|uniref:LuxR C-terminal-related transcriptional regulator n=1 Tax=Amycolatopsis sp. NPDC051758 TaxID=3363935 RepID=UPI0037B83F52
MPWASTWPEQVDPDPEPGKRPLPGESATMTTGNGDKKFLNPDAQSRPVPSIPVELNSFIGRGGLLERGRRLLRTPGTRLVTWTGFGGVGKTRLLMRIAGELQEERGYRDGVVVVSLLDVDEDIDGLYAAIADALDIPQTTAAPTLDRLCDFVRDRKLLLLLDNCEHLVGETPGRGLVPGLLNSLLRRAAGLQVMATSRVRLGVQGERVLPVPPLCVGDEDRCDCGVRPTGYLLQLGDGDTSQAQWVLGAEQESVGFIGEHFRPCPGTAACAEPTERVVGWVANVLGVTDVELKPVDGQGHWSVANTSHEGVHDALRLLLDRATELGVTISGRDYPVAEQLCRRLDGVPLAIELAAGRLDVKTLQELLDRAEADNILPTLVDGTSEQLQHRSMAGNIARSYDLLNDTERLVFALLSVFRSSFDLVAAVEVVSRLDVDPPEVEAVIVRLVRRSLLVAENRDGRMRYRMLETIRQFGRRRAAAAGDDGRLNQAHTSFCEQLAARTVQHWFGPREEEWMWPVNDYQPDLTATQERLLADSQTATRGLQLAVHLGQSRALIFGGRLSDMRRMLVAGLNRHSDAPSVLQVGALSQAVWVTLIQGKHDLAKPLLEQAEAAASALGIADAFAPLDVAHGTWLWLVEPDRDRARESLDRFRRAAESFRAIGALGDEWMARLFLVMSAAFLRCLDVARAEGTALLADAEAAGAKWCISWALWSCGLIELLDDNPRRAATLAQNALQLQRAIGDAWGPAWSLWLIALIAAQLGEYKTAAQVLGGAGARQESTQASVLGLLPFLRRQRQTEAVGRHELGDEQWDHYVSVGQNLSKRKMHALALEPLVTPAPETLPYGVTDREFEIARFVALGWTNAAIGKHLSIAPRTVGTHISNLNHKLGTESRTGIAAWYLTMDADPAGRNLESP